MPNNVNKAGSEPKDCNELVQADETVKGDETVKECFSESGNYVATHCEQKRCKSKHNCGRGSSGHGHAITCNPSETPVFFFH